MSLLIIAWLQPLKFNAVFDLQPIDLLYSEVG